MHRQGGHYTLNTFEHYVVATTSWTRNYEAFRCEGHVCVESKDRELKALRDDCSETEAAKHQLVKEAEDRTAEMQIALVSGSGDRRALISEHEMKVCASRTDIFEVGERQRRLRGELCDALGTSNALSTVGG